MSNAPRSAAWRAPVGVGALAVGLWILGSLAGPSAPLVTAALAAAAFLRFRGSLYRGLTGLPFAGSLLTILLLLTALGTFIPQGLAPEALEERYGKSWGGIIRGLGLDDLFHSFPFRGMLAVLALCMILVIFRRRSWRRPEWGLLMAHGGVALILSGGLIGNLWGQKGFIELRPGEETGLMKLQDAFGRPTGQEQALGFVLRLDRADREPYPDEYRLVLYRPEGERWKILSSIGPREAGRWIRAAGRHREFRLLRVFPDFDCRMELRESPPGEGVPALQIRLPGREPPEAVLLTAPPERAELRLDRDRALRFVWTGENSSWSEARPEEHRILTGPPGDPSAAVLRVRPGASYSLPGGRYELHVREYFPDFFFDLETRRASSRSDQPRNPVLRVSIRDRETGTVRERWLSAHAPDLGRGHGRSEEDPALLYQYVPGRDPAEQEFVVVGRTGEILEFRRGLLQGRGPLVPGSEPIPGVLIERLWPNAREEPRYFSRSPEWLRPVAEIEIREEEGPAKTLLSAGESLPLGSRDLVLAFERRGSEAKAYRSQVTILEGGVPVRRETILVNHPLAHRGYRFFQSRYDARGPASGILVVRDPGLAVAYAGLGAVSLGMILCLFFRRPPQVAGEEARP